MEAFRAAVDDARHMEGHGGYTGSIAEKSDFVEFDVAIEAMKYIGKYEARLHDCTVAAQKKLRREWEAAKAATLFRKAQRLRSRLIYVGQVYDPETRSFRNETLAEVCKARRASIRQEIKSLKTKGGRGTALARALGTFANDYFDDKWGPACCIRLTNRKSGDNKYLFCGMASS
jgi:hypothetical protein